MSENGQLSFVKKEYNSIKEMQDSFVGKELAVTKNLVNPDLRDEELLVFLQFCNTIKLNPFNKEIIPVVYNKDSAFRQVSYIVTRNGKRVVASRTGELETIISVAIFIKTTDEKGVVTRVEEWEGGKLWGAEAIVKRKGVDFKAIVPLSEYDTNKNLWNSKKSTMIKKVAESQALSSAFPEILGAVYDEAEMTSEPIDKGNLDIDPIKASEPASEAQIETLKSMGVEVTTTMTYQEAINLISNSLQKGKK